MAPEISIVIPALDEERYLPRLLQSLARASQRVLRGQVEVIVADNGSRDGTCRIAADHGCRVVHVGTRRIGAVRNAGARAARGTLLGFVDADMQVHPRTFEAMLDYFADGSRIAGLTGALPERHSTGIDLSWMFLGGLTMLAGYGIPRRFSELMPSGMLCCRRRDWEELGGYCERRLFAEDVRFLLDLQDLGRRRGQSAGWLRDAPAICSMRKFDRFGDWHYLTLPARLAFWWLADRSGIEQWARRYWYETPHR
jgi:glycosyltransferase involved in cell wall biosynthesis